VLAGIFDGAPVSIPLQLTAVSPIVGTLRHFVNQHTPSTFNAFVILGSAETNPPPALALARSGNSLVVSWPAVEGWNLYFARNPADSAAWSPASRALPRSARGGSGGV
jgi:hypothetical protein